MFSAQLYSKLSDEEKRILDTYTERVNQCQSKLKGLSYPEANEFRSFDEEQTHPKKVLSTYLLSDEDGVPQRTALTAQASVSETDLRHEPPEHDTSSKVSSKKDLSDTPKSKQTRTRSKHSNSSSKRHSREVTPKRSTQSQSRDSRPRSAQGRHSPARPKAKTLNLKVIPNLEDEVEKLLKVVYRFSKLNTEMATALEGGCKLYAQYARAMAAVSKRKPKGPKAV